MPAARIRAWALWRLPTRAVVIFLALDGLFAVLLVAGRGQPWHARDVWMCALLVAGGVSAVELTRSVKALHLMPTGSAVSMHDLWKLPAVVLLPPWWGLTMAGIMGVYEYLRLPSPRKAQHVLSTSILGLSMYAGGLALGWMQAVRGVPVRPLELLDPAAIGAVLVALSLRSVGNAVLVGLAVKSQVRHVRWREILWDADSLRHAVIEVSLGTLMVIAAAAWAPMVLVAVPTVAMLQRGMRFGELVRAASIDDKTGLASAAHWREAAMSALAGAGRAEAWAILLLDLDHFKRVNDTYGHLAGDEVLVAVARVLTEQTREGDVVGRFGGEEFSVLVRSGEREAQELAERLRLHIGQLRVAIEGSDAPLRVTVSVGGVRARPGQGFDELLETADRALYEAKGRGRDTVCFPASAPVREASLTPCAVPAAS